MNKTLKRMKTMTEQVIDTPATTPNADAPETQPATLLTTPQAPAGEPATPATEATETPGDKPEVKPGAPEVYEFTAPEGVTFDQAILDQFTPLAKEMNLPQDQAQKLVELYATAQKNQADAVQAQFAAWASDTKADKEIGGQHLEPTLHAAKVALAEFGTPELSKILEASGLGNHPEMVRFVSKVGRLMAEDKLHQGGNHNPAPSPLNALYPSMVRA
jgi:hypothetical protein